MNFDINLNPGHSFEAGDVYTNDQGISWLIAFIYPENNRACCNLTGSSNASIKLAFDQTSDDFRAVSLINGQLVLTTSENISSYCGLIFPSTKDENNNVTSLTGSLHRAYILPLK
tara:strand:- start:395 stop:739 length:345 start_codon:yes stop_codon:yes gene_type:complete